MLWSARFRPDQRVREASGVRRQSGNMHRLHLPDCQTSLSIPCESLFYADRDLLWLLEISDRSLPIRIHFTPLSKYTETLGRFDIFTLSFMGSVGWLINWAYLKCQKALPDYTALKTHESRSIMNRQSVGQGRGDELCVLIKLEQGDNNHVITDDGARWGPG